MPKKKIRRRLKLQEQTSRAEFIEKIKKYPIARGKEFRIDPPDQAKMSQVLQDFAGPLLDRYESEIPVKKIIGTAIMAWNLSLIPEVDHSKFLDQATVDLSLDTEGVKVMNDIITWLIARKKKYFAEHKRYIMDYRLSELDGRRGLQVVSLDVPGNVNKFNPQEVVFDDLQERWKAAGLPK